MIPIVQNKKTKQLYEYKGGNKFQNIITGAEGILDDDTANKVFLFCPEASEFFKEYPLVKELVIKLDLTLK